KELSFVVVRDLMAEWGLPVPRILDHDGARGILLLEDLGDLTLQDALGQASVAERADFYAQAMGQVARLQREAGSDQRWAACFQIAFDTEKLEWELQYFLKHFLEGHRKVELPADE